MVPTTGWETSFSVMVRFLAACWLSTAAGNSTVRTEPRKPSSSVVPGSGGGLRPL